MRIYINIIKEGINYPDTGLVSIVQAHIHTYPR